MAFIQITFNLPTILILGLFLAGSAASSIAHHQVGKAAKWLFKHQNQTWKEVGKPGTFWFKGSDKNSFMNRMSGWKNLKSEMMRNSSQLTKLPNQELSKFIQSFHQWRKWSRISLLVFIAIIFVLVLDEKL